MLDALSERFIAIGSIVWPTGAVCRLLLLVSYLAYFPTVKTEVICSSETLDYISHTQRYNPRDRVIHTRPQHTVACLLKAGILKPAETALARERLRKHAYY
jgi:hypothetical protein